MVRGVLSVIFVLSLAAWASAQTTQAVAPATRPVNRSAEEMLRQMLQPQGQSAQPLKPIADSPPALDATSGSGAVAPAAPTQKLAREGTILLDRIGRLTPSADGRYFEFNFEADGSALADPPMVLIPNKKLQQLEDRVKNSYSDLKLRISGEVLEYKGRNYLLLSRWSVLPDFVKPLQ